MRAISTTPYTQLAIFDVTLQEIGLLLVAERITFKGRPATVLGELLQYVTVLPITLDIAIVAPALRCPTATNSTASSPPLPRSTG